MYPSEKSDTPAEYQLLLTEGEDFTEEYRTEALFKTEVRYFPVKTKLVRLTKRKDIWKS